MPKNKKPNKDKVMVLVQERLEEVKSGVDLEHLFKVCAKQKSLSTAKLLNEIKKIEERIYLDSILLQSMATLLEETEVVYMFDKEQLPIRMGDKFTYLDDVGEVIEEEGVPSVKWLNGDSIPVQAFYFEPVDKCLMHKVM